ncbi:VWA domain-containing protein [Candidatus Woesearchaeota archaeon]|nr:VWA domain-containing protein [Candidatus Woesearchaeota archaeon]
MMFPDTGNAKPEVEKPNILDQETIEEISGKLSSQFQDQKLMHSVLENDKMTIDLGKVISDSINQGFSFSPDMLFEQLVKDFKLAKQIYGESFLRQMTGYETDYIDDNIRIPEFKKQIKENITRNVEAMKREGLLTKNNAPSEKGIELASLTLCMKELEKLMPRGTLGEKVHTKKSHYGDAYEQRIYRKGDRYRDIALKHSVKTALRRGHTTLEHEDLSVHERRSKGTTYIIYGLDASGSMKGKKLEECKKAGIALAYKAIASRDKVGLLAFGTDIKEEVAPTTDLGLLAKTIMRVRASKETDIKSMVQRALILFPRMEVTKHLIIITDAMPTVGKKPEEETLQAIASARNVGITISLIGIQLTEAAIEFARRITEIGKGRFYITKNIENLDTLMLQEYDAVG